MASKVLLIGATGNIGGAVLDSLLKDYPGVTVIAQVRSEEDSTILKNQYAQYNKTLQIVVAASIDSEALKQAAESAAVVLNCGPDVAQENNINKLLSTLACSITDQPKFYVGTTGAASMWDEPVGSPEARTWDDVSDIDDLLAFPESVLHIEHDRVVQRANHLHPLLHTALVSPTTVVGVSPSLKHPTPMVFPDWLHVVKTLGAGVTVNGGKNKTNFVHVKTVAKLYVLLAADGLARANGGAGAAASSSSSSKPETWGPKAYYFAGSLELSFHDFMAEFLLPALKEYGVGAPSYFDYSNTNTTTPKIQDLPDVSNIAAIIGPRYASFPGGDIYTQVIAGAFAINMRATGSRAEQVFEDKGFKWADVEEGDAKDQGIAVAVKAFCELEKVRG
ncbi:hypothetical protein QBC37DRAFT_414747 [Rhypophila decipiens]|uniref:NmrA-like domain-containing protein n=1 Tax=Rhypophila decipiens TaxID=261697 RepID=A0AAN6YDY2_9PEZI|nr:hypothetical protein QBC37DRAFT_414747 [Rhypophila decipiens]